MTRSRKPLVIVMDGRNTDYMNKKFAHTSHKVLTILFKEPLATGNLQTNCRQTLTNSVDEYPRSRDAREAYHECGVHGIGTQEENGAAEVCQAAATITCNRYT
jgi:hypothetical protein